MTLLERVSTLLAERSVSHALIGATALAVHGISRSTVDQDLLVTDPVVLDAAFWTPLAHTASIDLRRGDAEDPLAGVVRLSAAADRDVDVIVGRGAWQAAIFDRARPFVVGDRSVPVASPADLILLKLYAGGSQDRWDVEQLLTIDEGAAIAREVEARLPLLPPRCRMMWTALRPSGAT